jgi:hypothetical protein
MMIISCQIATDNYCVVKKGDDVSYLDENELHCDDEEQPNSGNDLDGIIGNIHEVPLNHQHNFDIYCHE